MEKQSISFDQRLTCNLQETRQNPAIIDDDPCQILIEIEEYLETEGLPLEYLVG